MSRMLSKMNLISVVQQLPKEDIETIQGYVEMIEVENQKYKEVIDKAIETLDNYQNNLYSKSAREFLDDDIERTITILKEVK